MTPETPLQDRVIDAVLKGAPYRYQDERDLQILLARVFETADLRFEREVGIVDRMDFLVDGRLAVEVKVDGSRKELLRQLLRYAQIPEVEGIVLVTGRALLAAIPESLNEKPVRAVVIHRGLA